MKRKPTWWLAAFVLICTGAAAGGEQNSESVSPAPSFIEEFFQQGRHEATFTSGVMFSPFLVNRHLPNVNYTLSEFQFGWMLQDVKEAGWLRGNFELVADGFGGAVLEGKGGYVAGTALWLRYNFVPWGWRLVPYAQAGAGLTTTDIDRRIIGETFNFNLDLSAGVRWFFARNWSGNLEYRYQHISDANLTKTNVGINANGPILGVSFFF